MTHYVLLLQTLNQIVVKVIFRLRIRSIMDTARQMTLFFDKKFLACVFHMIFVCPWVMIIPSTSLELFRGYTQGIFILSSSLTILYNINLNINTIIHKKI